MAYISLVRSQLEYSSAVWASASKTNLKKLDTIQKIASRIVTHAPRLSHSEPLIKAFQLESISSRRTQHLCKIVQSCVQGSYHPALNELFVLDEVDQLLKTTCEERIGIGKRRFEVFARDIYNESINT